VSLESVYLIPLYGETTPFLLSTRALVASSMRPPSLVAIRLTDVVAFERVENVSKVFEDHEVNIGCTQLQIRTRRNSE
jgi:hypothetical protein